MSPGSVSLLFFLTACAPSAPAPSAARAVRVFEVAPRSLDAAARYAAALDARDRVDVAFKVPGRVASVAEVGGRPIQEGDPVRRGQALAVLDTADLSRQSAAASAALAAAVAQAEGARAAHAQATIEVGRARSLAAGGDLTPAELDRAESALAGAAAALRAAEAQVEARVEQLALARGAVDDATLRSPIDGLVARRMFDAGESVAPGMAAFTVIDPSQMRVAFAVPDTRVAELELGARVPVRVEAFAGRAFVGEIVEVSPVADPALRAFTVELAVDNPDGALRAGMVASVAVSGAPEAPATLVPLGGIVRDPADADGFAVYVVDEAAVARLRPVRIADLVGNEAVVEQGLVAGERVVVDGAALLHDGAPVEVRP